MTVTTQDMWDIKLQALTAGMVSKTRKTIAKNVGNWSYLIARPQQNNQLCSFIMLRVGGSGHKHLLDACEIPGFETKGRGKSITFTTNEVAVIQSCRLKIREYRYGWKELPGINHQLEAGHVAYEQNYANQHRVRNIPGKMREMLKTAAPFCEIFVSFSSSTSTPLSPSVKSKPN